MSQAFGKLLICEPALRRRRQSITVRAEVTRQPFRFDLQRQSTGKCRSRRGKTQPDSCRRIEDTDATSQSSAVTHRVVIVQEFFPALHRYVISFLKQHGMRLEMGGMLVGEYAAEERPPAFKIQRLIEAGPGAECSRESVLFDHEYQSAVLQSLQAQQPHLGNMGCIHLHPGQMDTCSPGDHQADIAAVKESDTRALVFGIMTLNNSRHDPLSVRHRNLKVDFFLLGEQTGFEYVHVRPEIAATPSPACGLGKLSSRRGAISGFGVHRSWGPGLLEDKRRLVAEVRAMEERYGDRAVLRHERNQLFWEYTVIESGRRFPIEVRYPRRYPLEPPRIISVLPLPSSPHQLVNNELCWINRAAGDWNPARDTAATCIHAAQRWFACLLVYLTLGQWPEEANDEPLRTL